MNKERKQLYDKERYKAQRNHLLAQGKTRRESVRINVPCRGCNKDRWVVKYQYDYISKLPRYTGLCRKCAAQSRAGELSPRWKGGRIKSGGYTRIRLASSDFFYPMVNNKRYVMEHRLVMAKHLNRCLLTWEVVHHKNGNKLDNRIENLQLLPSSGKHNTQMNKYILKLEEENSSLRLRVKELENSREGMIK